MTENEKTIVESPAGLGVGEDDVAAVKALNQAYTKMTDQLGKVIVGQKQVIE